jgi:hypothetical protein
LGPREVLGRDGVEQRPEPSTTSSADSAPEEATRRTLFVTEFVLDLWVHSESLNSSRDLKE